MRRIFILLFVVFTAASGFSQKIVRSSLSSFGNTSFGNGIEFRQTVGQPSNTSEFFTKDLILRQGFQQPVKVFLGHASPECSLNLSPNPTADRVSIEFMENIGEYQISIFDLNGKLLLRAASNSSEHYEMDIRGLADGVYLLNVLSKTGYHCNQKLVILL